MLEPSGTHFINVSAQCLLERCVGEVIKPHAVMRWAVFSPVYTSGVASLCAGTRILYVWA